MKKFLGILVRFYLKATVVLWIFIGVGDYLDRMTDYDARVPIFTAITDGLTESWNEAVNRWKKFCKTYFGS